jgi:hypothetical protein
MRHRLPLIDRIEACAKREGSKWGRIYGRKGCLHVLEDYEEKHFIVPVGLTGRHEGH